MTPTSDKSPQPGADHTGPDEAPLDRDDVMRALRVYVVGFVLAAGLSVASFVAPISGLIWAPSIPVALVVFAIAQMGVHLVFFLHLTTGPDNTNNALALAFGVLVVFLVIGGSIWIMGHLNHNMLPMSTIMQMQR